MAGPDREYHLSSTSSNVPPEYESVKQCTSSLVEALQHCISGVASECLAKGLISEDVYSYIHVTIPDSQKASRILECVRTKIKINYSKFDDFVKVLQSNRFLEDVQTLLIDTYNRLKTNSCDRHEWIQDIYEYALITAANFRPNLSIVKKALEIGINPNTKEKDEYESVKQCTSSLVEALQHCISGVASECLAKGLISEEVYSYIHVTIPDSQKASRILECVRTKIKINNSKFDDFVKVLQSNRFLEDVQTLLIDTYNRLKTNSCDRHEWIQDIYEYALITAAGFRPDLSIVKKSLEIGVNPNAKEKDEYGWTALMWASEKGFAEIVIYLVDQKADVNARDFAHWTSLILSSRRGYLSIVRKLLDGGADVNKKTESLWSALMWTAQLGHTDVARLLLERGADAHMRDEAGFTPFLQASQDGNIDIVKLLVEHEKEFDVNEVTKTGWSAAMLATKNGHENLLEFLIEQDCDIHYQRKEDDITALHIASFKDNNKIVRRLCIHEKLKVNVQDCDGVTPLMYAAKKGLVQVSKTLVENGHAEVNIAENDNEWTALFFAMEGRHNDLLDYLLRATKVNLNHRDKWGHTIVDIAKSMNPDALDLFSKYYKTETDAILSKPAAPVNLKNYQQMLERISFKVSATPKASIMAGAA